MDYMLFSATPSSRPPTFKFLVEVLYIILVNKQSRRTQSCNTSVQQFREFD
jgi:hypothetical protein